MAKVGITKFGVLLRRHRVERGETLYTMAKAVGVSSSFLSGVETGQKRAPDELVQRLIEHLGLDMVDALHLREAAQQTGPELRIPLRGKGNDAREVAAMFARRFDNGDMEALRQALEKLEAKKKEPAA